MTNYLKLARLNQPVGIGLLFLPCLFGIFLTIKKLPSPDIFEIIRTISLFLVGSIIMRSAGCVINDLIDHKFDKKVERTKTRPLASGAISKGGALLFLIILLSCGFLILLQFNQKTIIAGFAALTLVIAYPLMKRITHYPQIFLGLTFNFGILMTSLAILNKITAEALILYIASIIWTVIYDTIYAYQDIEDDLKIGVKSTAIKFQKNPKKVLIFLSLAMFLTLIYLGYYAKFQAFFFFTLLLISLFLDGKIKNCDFKNSKDCLKVFKMNIFVGILILTAIILG